MVPFASLADKNMSEKIAKEISRQGIAVQIQVDPETNHYVLFTDNHQNIQKAQDVYRVMMGLPKQFETDREWQEIQAIPLGPVTKGTIGFCIAMFILGYYKLVPELYPTMMMTPDYFSNFQMATAWRIVTPIFVHFGMIHILFNMMWMKDLGKVVEIERGGNFLVAFMILVGALSNASQFFSISSSFGGMSGVIYGLLGYLWMYKRFNIEAQFSLPKRDVLIMVGWFFLCLSGLLAFSIANMAHAMGLSLGMIVGIVLGMKESSKTTKSSVTLFYIVFAVLLPILTQVVEVFKMSLKSGL